MTDPVYEEMPETADVPEAAPDPKPTTLLDLIAEFGGVVSSLTGGKPLTNEHAIKLIDLVLTYQLARSQQAFTASPQVVYGGEE